MKRFSMVRGLLPRLLAGAFLLASCRGAAVLPPAPPVTVPLPRGSVGASFVMVSDTQQAPIVNAFMRGGPRERRQVRERIRALAPDVILHAGDAVGLGGVKRFWKGFRRAYAGMKLYPVLGNHDLMGPNRTALRHYFETFPHLRGARWYRVRLGPVVILMLDSNRRSLGPRWAEQLAWLDQELAATRHDRTVGLVALLSHHPPLSTSRGGSQTVLRELYARAAAYPRFRLHLSGHHHAYQHLQDGDRHVLVAGGGGGPLFHHPGGALPAPVRLVTKHYAHHVVRGVLEADRLRVEVHLLGQQGGWTVPEGFHIPLQGPPLR
jgi:3',5'-cyclic AMP phosphodiesterase CpdA